MSDQDPQELLSAILADPQYWGGLQAICVAGRVRAEGRRVVFRARQTGPDEYAIETEIAPRREAIPAEDWARLSLSLREGRLWLSGDHKWLAPGPGFEPKGWAFVRFDEADLRAFVADFSRSAEGAGQGGAAPEPTPGKRRRGPRPGTAARYGNPDRALYSEIDRRLRDGKSLTGATEELADEGHIQGHGDPKNLAKRLRDRYTKDKGGTA